MTTYECFHCNEQRLESELTLLEPCEHIVCHYCVNTVANKIQSENPYASFFFPCKCGNEHRQKQLDLSFLPQSVVVFQDPKPKKPVDDQKFNWEFGSQDKAAVIKAFYYLTGQHAEDKLIKEALIILYHIDYLAIIIRLKRKQREGAMQRILPGLDLKSFEGQMNFSFYRIELAQKNIIYSKHIINTVGNAEFYNNFIEVIEDLRKKGFL